MKNRTFKVVEVDCSICGLKNECAIKGISRDEVYQSLKDAKLYSFVYCASELNGPVFMQVEEEK